MDAIFPETRRAIRVVMLASGICTVGFASRSVFEALWASGAAQAAHVVRIILRFAVSYWGLRALDRLRRRARCNLDREAARRDLLGQTRAGQLTITVLRFASNASRGVGQCGGAAPLRIILRSSASGPATVFSPPPPPPRPAPGFSPPPPPPACARAPARPFLYTFEIGS